MHPLLRSIAACALASAFAAASPALAAQAGWRQTTVPGLANAQQPIPVNLYYPTEAAETSIAMGPFLAHVAPRATHRTLSFKGLIVISHGLAGSELIHESLAEALARRGYLVAALRHPGDNWQDHSLIDRGATAYLDERPRQVSRVIDALLADPQWSGRIAHDAHGPRVGALGHSAGGYTVLALAGGRYDVARLRAHCDANRADDPIFCRRTAGPIVATPVDPSPVADPRVRAVVALSPLGAAFDPDSLERITVPTALYVAEKDRFLVPRFHGEWVAGHIPGATCCRSCRTRGTSRSSTRRASRSSPMTATCVTTRPASIARRSFTGCKAKCRTSSTRHSRHPRPSLERRIEAGR